MGPRSEKDAPVAVFNPPPENTRVLWATRGFPQLCLRPHVTAKAPLGLRWGPKMNFNQRTDSAAQTLSTARQQIRTLCWHLAVKPESEKPCSVSCRKTQSSVLGTL